MLHTVYLLILFCGCVAGLYSGCNQTVSLNDTVSTLDLNDVNLTSTACTWNLQSLKGTTIVVKVNDVVLEGRLDRVTALDGANENSRVIQQCGSECSKLNGSIFVSSKSSMQVIIELSQDKAIRIVSVQAWAQENGGRFYDNGDISFSKNSTSNVTYYQLHSTKQNQVQVMLDNALMYPYPLTIQIYDGTSQKDQILATFRSKTPFVPVTSSQQDLLIVASYIELPQYFNGTFSTVQPGCHQVSPKPSGDFILDRNNFNSDCDWLINPTHSSGNILLEIRSVDLCDNETLVIYEGLSKFGQLLANVTKETQKPVYPKFTAHVGQGLSIFLIKKGASKTCESIVPSSFFGSYWITPDCNTENMTSSGPVTSPLYPAQYPLNSVCKWSPKPLNKTSSLYITFNNLDLAKGHTVSILNKLDPVMVYNGMKGSNLPPDFIMKVEKNSTASISFDSSTIDLGKGVEAVGQGFSLLYRTLECGSTFNGSEGTIDSTKLIPSGAKECIWVVTLPPPTGKTVNIVSFTVSLTGILKWQNLELRDGGSVRSPLLNTANPMGKSLSLLTRYNLLWIHYRMNKTGSDFTADKDKFSFNLEYTTYSCDTKHQCKNTVCLHPDWRCNNVDDCGDNTDEIGCESSSTTEKGVKIWLAAVIGAAAFLVGVVLAIVIPALYKRYKYSNYAQFKNEMDPADS